MIDFVNLIDHHMCAAVKDVITAAIFRINHDSIWQYGIEVYDDRFVVFVWHKDRNLLLYGVNAFINFNRIAGQTISAALLEQLHNEVTTWFTAIKEGVSA